MKQEIFYYPGYVFAEHKYKEALLKACKGIGVLWSSKFDVDVENKIVNKDKITSLIKSYAEKNPKFAAFKNAIVIKGTNRMCHMIMTNSNPSIVEEFILCEKDLALYAEGKEKAKQLK